MKCWKIEELKKLYDYTTIVIYVQHKITLLVNHITGSNIASHNPCAMIKHEST